MYGNKWCYFHVIIVVLLFVFVEKSYQTQCDFCKKDFKSLGRHTWRCKTKLSAYESITDSTSTGNS